MTLAEKKEKLNAVLKNLNREREKKNPESAKTIFWAGTEEGFTKLEFLSTGNPALDKALGGGYRKGVPSELFGGPGVGKTVLGLMACKSCLEEGGLPVFISTESSQEPTEQRIMAGISDEEWSNVLFIYANGSGEEIFNRIREMMWDSKKEIPQHIFDLVVIDSIAALLPHAELTSIEKNGFEGATMGRHAHMVGKFYRFMCGLMAPKSVLLSINQTRSSMEQYKADESTGGNATRYYNKVRISLGIAANGETRTAGLYAGKDKEERKIGNLVNFQVIKNNAGGGKPYARGQYAYVFGVGLDIVTPIFEEALEVGVIWKDSPTSNMHKFLLPDGTEHKVNGYNNALQYFKDNADSFATLRTAVESVRSAEVVKDLPETNLHQIEDVEEESEDFKEAEAILESLREDDGSSEIVFAED